MDKTTRIESLSTSVLKAIAKGIGIGDLHISRNRDGSVGACSWGRGPSLEVAALVAECIRRGYVIVAQTDVGFAACAPQDRSGVRGRNWETQRPVWRG